MFHKSDGLNDEALKELREAYKPTLFVRILTTAVFIAPYGHLLLDIIDKKYDRLLSLTIISAPLIAWVTFIWTKYFYDMRKYKKEVSDYFSDPENYQW